MSQAEESDRMSEGSEEWEDQELESVLPLPDSMTTGSKTSDHDSKIMRRCPLQTNENSEERTNQI